MRYRHKHFGKNKYKHLDGFTSDPLILTINIGGKDVPLERDPRKRLEQFAIAFEERNTEDDGNFDDSIRTFNVVFDDIRKSIWDQVENAIPEKKKKKLRWR